MINAVKGLFFSLLQHSFHNLKDISSICWIIGYKGEVLGFQLHEIGWEGKLVEDNLGQGQGTVQYSLKIRPLTWIRTYPAVFQYTKQFLRFRHCKSNSNKFVPTR